MRPFLTVAVGLALAMGCATGVAAADAPKPVNTICPSEGDKVDPKLAPVTVTLKDGRSVTIGICCKDCSDEIKKDPEKFAAAALANKQAAK